MVCSESGRAQQLSAYLELGFIGMQNAISLMVIDITVICEFVAYLFCAGKTEMGFQG